MMIYYWTYRSANAKGGTIGIMADEYRALNWWSVLKPSDCMWIIPDPKEYDLV